MSEWDDSDRQYANALVDAGRHRALQHQRITVLEDAVRMLMRELALRRRGDGIIDRQLETTLTEARRALVDNRPIRHENRMN